MDMRICSECGHEYDALQPHECYVSTADALKAEYSEAGMGMGRVYVGDTPITDTVNATHGRDIANAYNGLVEGDETYRKFVRAWVYDAQQPPYIHGGSREGAGRKPLGDAVRVTVVLTPEQVAKAEALGNGNVSEGIRRALQQV
jgi:hypothetical protein